MANEPVDVIEVGRLFHKRGPATAKDLSPDNMPRSIGSIDMMCSVGWDLNISEPASYTNIRISNFDAAFVDRSPWDIFTYYTSRLLIDAIIIGKASIV